jgi:hypothetical protein
MAWITATLRHGCKFGPSLIPAAAHAIRPLIFLLVFAGSILAGAAIAGASEADLAIPDLHEGKFNIFGVEITAWQLLFYGAFVICGTLGISLYQFFQIKKQPAHQSMLDIAEIIFQTCKTYLIQQGKFLLMLFVLIAIAISYYLLAGHEPEPGVGEGRRPLPRPLNLRSAGSRPLSWSCCSRSSAWAARMPSPGTASASTPTPMPARRLPRCGASRGMWSTFRCEPACRSACS